MREGRLGTVAALHVRLVCSFGGGGGAVGVCGSGDQFLKLGLKIHAVVECSCNYDERGESGRDYRVRGGASLPRCV